MGQTYTLAGGILNYCSRCGKPFPSNITIPGTCNCSTPSPEP